jgi:hypothetical protein
MRITAIPMILRLIDNRIIERFPLENSACLQRGQGYRDQVRPALISTVTHPGVAVFWRKRHKPKARD